MDQIVVDDLNLSACALGSGPGVVLLHGWGQASMASFYFSLGMPLSQQGRRVLMYDQRGHGNSGWYDRGYDLYTQSKDLEKVLEHFGADDDGRIDVVGHSMGALIALEYALQAPERVRSLVLIDAPMPASQWVAPSLRDWKEYASSALPSPGRRQQRQRERLNYLIMSSTLMADIAGMQAVQGDALKALNMPVLLIYGETSPCREVADELLQHLPQAKLVTLPCGHYIPEEASEALRDLLLNFLRYAD